MSNFTFLWILFLSHQLIVVNFDAFFLLNPSEDNYNAIFIQLGKVTKLLLHYKEIPIELIIILSQRPPN